MPILAAICASDSPSRAQPSICNRPSGSNHCSYLPGLAIVNHSFASAFLTFFIMNVVIGSTAVSMHT